MRYEVRAVKHSVRQRRILSRAVLGCTFFASVLSAAVIELRAQAATVATPAVVARLSLLDGDVHVSTTGYHADSVDTARNMPLSAGQLLQTGANSDAEVEFPDGSVLRSTAKSAATLIRLQPQTEIGLDDGLYYLELRAGEDPQFVVYAGDLSISPTENASFRVHVQNGQPEIAVLRGALSVTRANSYTVDLQRGESLRTDAKDNRRYLLADSIAPETGDAWNERRAQQVADAAASQTIAREDYASEQGYGWSDLDNDGTWYPLPGEGLVWQPNGVDASFDPYSFGSWVYGGGSYVWASGYSWGWLPYHCGSWGFFPGLGWGWQPAAGCRSFGAGWSAGGFPVRHPPHGWHGPQPPKPPTSNGIVTRHPTFPIAREDGGVRLLDGRRHAGPPLQLDGIVVRPLAPIAPPPTPRGSSAVGSALRRDYPVQNGTHLPVFGREHEGPAVMPGRAPDWHSPVTIQSRGEEPGHTAPSPSLAAGGAALEPGTAVIVHGIAGPLPGNAVPGQSYMTGWHARVPPPSPPVPAGLPRSDNGAVILNHRPVFAPATPGGAGSVAPREPVAPPIRVAPVSPVIPRASMPLAPPRVNMPAPPSSAPHMNAPAPPSSSPRMNAPAAPSPAPRIIAPNSPALRPH